MTCHGTVEIMECTLWLGGRRRCAWWSEKVLAAAAIFPTGCAAWVVDSMESKHAPVRGAGEQWNVDKLVWLCCC